MAKIVAFVLVVAAASGLTATAADEDVVVSFVAYNSGNALESVITTKELERTPAWKEPSPNPPLSARDAMKLADTVKGKFVHDTEDGAWQQVALELRRATTDRWFWLARYELEQDCTGPIPDLTLLILMDGTVITPQIYPERKFTGHFGGSANSVEPNFFLNGTRMTDEGLRNVANWTELRGLQQYGVAEITDAGLEHLKGLTQLEVLTLTGPKITDAGLEHLKGLTQLECLTVGSPSITGAGLKHLAHLTKLESLNLDDSGITDAGLEHLKGFTRLKYLYLNGTRVTGMGLGQLKGLSQLEELNLEGTQITDAGMAHFQGLKQLQALDLDGNQVTDAGLEHLRGLKRLVNLDLQRTQVTDAGVKTLEQALPNCAIRR